MLINKLPATFTGLLFIGLLSSCSTPQKSSITNLVAAMEVKEPINGVCDNSNVIVILPFPGNGQVSAKAPKTNLEIAQELNEKVLFLKDKPDYEDTGMVNLIINCKGNLVKCDIDNETKSPELDKQIVAVFSELKNWTAGKVNNNSVDTVVMYRFTIKNGKILL